MKISIFKDLISKTPLDHETTFNELVDLFEEAARQVTLFKGGNELWSPGVYTGIQHRAKANVSYVDLIGLDCDDPTNDMFDAMYRLYDSNINYIVYTSYRHTDAAHKFRIVLPLSFSISNSTDYKNVFDAVGRWLSPTILDQACSDISRIFYLPTTNPEVGECEVFSFNGGNDLDWKVLLSLYPGAPTIPVNTNVFTAPKKLDKQEIDEALHLIKQYLPSPKFLEWRAICHSLAHEIGVAEAKIQMRALWPEQKLGEYDNIFKSYQVGASPTLGTLIHFARKFDPDFLRTHEQKKTEFAIKMREYKLAKGAR
jgi:hypothetical protein